MLADRYVWLAWSCSFLIPWAVLFCFWPRLRLAMWWSSVLAMPFAMSEPLFLGHYWSPPSLFNLARLAHFDLESFIYCFAIGGVGGVGYNVVTGKPLAILPRTTNDERWRAIHVLALGAPMPPFFAVLLLTMAPIWAGIAGFVGGAAARFVVRPDLIRKSVAGGFLFLLYYVAFLLYLRWLAPGYMERVWLPTGSAGRRLFGLPLTELLFAVGFGLYWSGLYEQIEWTLSPVATAGSFPADR